MEGHGRCCCVWVVFSSSPAHLALRTHVWLARSAHSTGGEWSSASGALTARDSGWMDASRQSMCRVSYAVTAIGRGADDVVAGAWVTAQLSEEHAAPMVAEAQQLLQRLQALDYGATRGSSCPLQQTVPREPVGQLCTVSAACTAASSSTELSGAPRSSHG